MQWSLLKGIQEQLAGSWACSGGGNGSPEAIGNGGTFSTQTRVLTSLTVLFEVFLGSLAPRAQPARKGSLAAMESQGQWERRASQVR